MLISKNGYILKNISKGCTMPKKIRLCLGGSEGRMGRIIQTLSIKTDDIKVIYGFDPKKKDLKSLSDVFSLEEKINEKVDVYLDFTNPTAVLENVSLALKAGIDSVIGTTGWYNRIDEVKTLAKKYDQRILYASNFSPGVNVLFYLTQEAARLLGKFNYDATVREVHHIGKVDAPSGTAITLGNILLKELKNKTRLTHIRKDKRGETEIDVLGQRVGLVAGQHEIWFTPKESYSERLILQHDTLSPEILGIATLKGVRWIVEAKREQKPAGLYNFYEDVLGLGKL